jgi:hypothetical protein
VVHTELGSLLSESANAELERGPVIHPATALRLACDCRLQAVLEDRADHALGIGRTSRVVPRWLARQLLQRDRGCTFPGCGATRLSPRPPHRALAKGRAHRARQPLSAVLLPPQAGT